MRKIILLFILLLVTSNGFALTLQQAIEVALKQSPDVLIQRHKEVEAKEQKRAKIATSYGKISAVGSYTYYNLPRTLAPITPPIKPDIVTSKGIYSLGLKYSLPLFKGFQDVIAINISSLEKNIAQIKYNLTKAQLIFNIKSLFYKILSLKDQLRTLETYRNALNVLYNNTQLEVRVGRKASIDLLKIKSDLEEVDFNIVNIKNSINSLKSALAFTIGVDRVKKVEDVDIKQDMDFNFKIKDTYKYKLAKAELYKANQNVLKSKTLYLPRINFSVYYGNNYAREEKKELWQVGLTCDWLLFDFGAREAEIAKANSLKMSALLRLEKTAMEIKNLIVDIQNKIKTERERIRSLKSQLVFLQKVRKVEEIKYKNGVSNMYDLLLSIAKEKQAQNSLVEAKYNLNIHQAYLEYIVKGAK
ncbi:Outer membrane protein TolC [Desulfonauticus submarinus]|uniref:Outer membrane protein TolC n=1 Tax=Desulfonauticus submarinus TaxID=206665 RepID=A0A1H0BMF7_9BACT|nr:TolC family protein [Desulfonauticus submarinus]SDN46772.1 Outer membrane protein TolC [Desulfonauticus submarinus]